VVYLADPEIGGVFRGREIVLGRRVGDFYIVSEGLVEGDLVVTNGNFKIDSALQIRAEPSMMNPEGGAMPAGHFHKVEKQAVVEQNRPSNTNISLSPAFLHPLEVVYSLYFEMHALLSHDNFADIKSKTEELTKILKTVDNSDLDNRAREDWMAYLKGLNEGIETMAAANDISRAREGFETLSIYTIKTAERFGSEKHHLIVYHCPMAFDDKGADWLQNKEDLENPYFGSSMFRCGSIKANLTPGGPDKHGGHDHE
jgi:Cu(I)/Ag(I) efflux system membrane fusion protein